MTTPSNLPENSPLEPFLSPPELREFWGGDLRRGVAYLVGDNFFTDAPVGSERNVGSLVPSDGIRTRHSFIAFVLEEHDEFKVPKRVTSIKLIQEREIPDQTKTLLQAALDNDEDLKDDMAETGIAPDEVTAWAVKEYLFTDGANPGSLDNYMELQDADGNGFWDDSYLGEGDDGDDCQLTDEEDDIFEQLTGVMTTSITKSDTLAALAILEALGVPAVVIYDTTT